MLDNDLVFHWGNHSTVPPVDCRGRGFVGEDTPPGWLMGSRTILQM